jgi:hypothetical protein
VEEHGKVVRIWCFPNYEGKFREVFHPGMTVAEVIRLSNKQAFIHGMLVIDAEFGASFDVPEVYNGKPYDDVDSAKQLPAEMILEQIHVMDNEWWR